MATDIELLELAAKAVGIEIVPHANRRLFKDLMFVACKTGRNWNPLIDDGDALRLAVSLKLNIHQGDFSLWVDDEDVVSVEDVVVDEKERLADTRRVIVRAAAVIGMRT